MTQMTKPRDLFLHELRDIYYVEKALVQTLPKLAREASDAELTRGFQQHLRQTEKHVRNVEKVFQELGVQPSAEQCPGFDGIKAEHDEFTSENDPSDEVRDLFLTGAAARTEHYEIAAYTGLVALARALGERTSVRLLEENLSQEKETLRKVDAIGRRIGRESAKSNGRATARTGTRTRRTTSGSTSSRRKTKASRSRTTTSGR